MRNWMDLFEDETGVPTLLFHGAPIENLINIFVKRVIFANHSDEGPKGVSASRSLLVAQGFAHSDSRDGNYLHTEILQVDYPRTNGAVFVLDSRLISAPIEEYDDHAGGEEEEFRILGDVPLTACVRVYVNKAEVEQYREALEQAQSVGIKGWEGASPDMLEWLREWLDCSPEFFKAIDEILTSNKVFPLPNA